MYYLKAESEEALWEALENAGVVYDSLPIAGVDLDVIGTIWQPTGETTLDEDGNLIQVSAPLEGYHANIRGITAEQAAQLPTIDAPANPVRMWAGDVS